MKVIIGCGYGDEGKGMTVATLASQNPNSIVVRYGGGNQVGHTVTTRDFQHVHTHTGSGSLFGIPTFYSRFCTVDPIGTVIELDKLKTYNPTNIYDPRCMIVTPLDVKANRKHEQEHAHGSVGVGFGKTIERNENHYRLTVMDILNEFTFKAKCRQICNYYDDSFDIDGFYLDCLEFAKKVKCEFLLKYSKKDLIFEGHQGILLDKEYGVFPHVTRSKTTGKNAYTLIEELGYKGIVENYLITRCYHTKHGNGEFFESPIKLKNNHWETNKTNKYQGRFRTAPLDIELLKSAIVRNTVDCGLPCKQNLVVTCLDQVENPGTIIEQLKLTKANLLFSNNPYNEISNNFPITTNRM